MKVTVEGIQVNIDPDALNDFDAFELLCKIEDGHAECVPKWGRMVFGEKEWERLKAKYRKAHDGKLSIDGFMAFIILAIRKAGEQAKNS